MTMENEKFAWLPLIALFAAVTIIWGLSWHFLINSPLLTDWAQRGTFGDMFGAINALFSGLAFSGVIYAIILQRKELMLQRRELEFTRKEIEGQKIQLEEQNKTSKLQRFESTFFKLIEMLDSVIEKIDLSNHYISTGPNGGSKKIMGNAALATAYNSLKRRYDEKHAEDQTEETVLSSYIQFYETHHKFFGHFFRNLYHLLEYVNSSEIINKELYFDLIRARLDEHAILLTFYNSYAEMGGSGMKRIVSEIQFFKNIDRTKFLRSDDLNLFPKTAFGSDY